MAATCLIKKIQRRFRFRFTCVTLHLHSSYDSASKAFARIYYLTFFNLPRPATAATATATA